jgi:hypothetical protein
MLAGGGATGEMLPRESIRSGASKLESIEILTFDLFQLHTLPVRGVRRAYVTGNGPASLCGSRGRGVPLTPSIPSFDKAGARLLWFVVLWPDCLLLKLIGRQQIVRVHQFFTKECRMSLCVGFLRFSL